MIEAGPIIPIFRKHWMYRFGQESFPNEKRGWGFHIWFAHTFYICELSEGDCALPTVCSYQTEAGREEMESKRKKET